MQHTYLTSFGMDHFIQGIALLRSLLAHDPDAQVRVICLDQNSFVLLVKMSIPNILPVSSHIIEKVNSLKGGSDFHSEADGNSINAVKNNKYFTAQDILLYFLDQIDTEALTYVEPNILFFASPQPLFEALENCSVLVSEGQHFSTAHPAIGWISVRNTVQSRDILKRECEELMYIQTDLFFHYHSSGYLAPGILAPALDLSYQCTLEMIQVYAVAYLKALDAEISSLFNSSIFAKIENIDIKHCLVAHTEHIQTLQDTYPALLPLEKGYFLAVSEQLINNEKLCGYTSKVGDFSWTGNYPDWQSALSVASGYDSEKIFLRCRDAARAVRNGEALWERDSLLFNTPQMNKPVVAALIKIAAKSKNCLNVLDFGGSFGSTWIQNRPYLSQLKQCTWHVVEQPQFVKCGQEEFTTDHLFFHYTIEEALASASINVILLSSVLQYVEFPYQTLQKMIDTGLPLILDRTYMLEDEDRLTVQRSPSVMYEASYPVYWLNKARIKAILEKAGYKLSSWFASAVDPKGAYGVVATKQV